METKTDNIIDSLHLYGEQMSLKSRETSEKNKFQSRSRPKSALYSTDAMSHVPKRRPLSAGTDPRSPKFNSFLRTSKREEPAKTYNYPSRNTPIIPGSAESSLLLDKLLQDPLKTTNHLDYNISDNVSDISSVENCPTFETSKPKIKTPVSLIDEKAASLKANAIKLKKYRSPSIERLLQKNYNSDPPLEDKLNKTPTKLTVCVPNTKDENTSSGVSSSSEVHRFSSPRLSESTPENYDTTNIYSYKCNSSNKQTPRPRSINWFPNGTNENFDKNGWDFETNRNKDLTGRVSFGNTKHFEKVIEPNMYTFNQDPELSLVEEESSQDSDGSGNHRVKFKLNGEENRSSDNNTIERKFKELQQKYKFEEMNITKKHSSYISNLDDKNKRSSDWEFLNDNKKNEDAYTKNHESFSQNNNYSSNEGNHFKNTEFYNDNPNDETESKSYSFGHVQTVPEKLNSVPKIVVEEVPSSNNTSQSSNENPSKDTKYISPEDKSKEDVKCYPHYLNENENKMYTSKVLEDYKKEIASIENSHELALKDLRNTFSYETKSYSDGDFKENRNNDTSPLSKSSFNLNESQRVACNNFSDNDALSKEMSELSHDIERSTLRKPKVKRKIKKKEKNIVSKETIITSNTTNSLKRDSSRKPNYRTRSLKSAPVRKTIPTSKFKQHKITMSKSTTNINHTSYIDYDNDVESWMATHVSQSPENTFFINKGENISNNSSVNSDVSKLEKEIKPIIHSKISLAQENNNSGNDFSMMTSNHSFKEMPKLKEVSFKDDYDSDQDSNDWHQDEENQRIHEILDNNDIVSNIHSALNEMPPSTLYKLDYDEHTTSEYKDIMDFLEHVENSANQEISSLSHTQPIFALKIEELMELSKAELAHKAVSSALAAGKAGETAAKLRAALSEAVKRTGIKLQSAKQSARQKIATATQNSAVAIARHQKFIEQLITEKKALSERIEQLVAAAASAETRRARAASAATERLQLELKNQRQRLSAAHHRDKQAWLKQHTQKIKEMTVRSLESEIKDMEERHTAQLSLLKKENDEFLFNEREKHIREIRLVKERAAQNLEDELDKERLLAAERLEQKRVEWEVALGNAAERAGKEAKEAARRAEENSRLARKEAEIWLNQKDKEMSKKIKEFEKIFDDKKQALSNEMEQLKERMNDDFESYKEEFVKKQNENFKIREMEIKSLMRRERDREIEKAVDCMELEAQRNKNETQENIRRLKDKYEMDIQMLEESEKTALQKCKNLHEQLKDMQECYSSQQITITQLEGKMKQLEELRSQAEKQTDIAVKMAESKSKEKINEIQEQMKQLQQHHKDEMHQLYAKVKLAVSKKDNALTAARREASTLRERCVRLEARQD